MFQRINTEQTIVFHIYCLSKVKIHRILIMKYLHFFSYRLRLGAYSGAIFEIDIAYGLSRHKDSPFSTVDRDRDDDPTNLAVKHHGGWWYRGGDIVNLNGLCGEVSIKGVHWSVSRYNKVYPSYTEMKIRRLNT